MNALRRILPPLTREGRLTGPQSTKPPYALLAAIAISAVLACCSDSKENGSDSATEGAETAIQAPSEWPEGAVLAIDDLPIFSAEIERVAMWVEFLHPENTQPSLRRQALTHIVLDRTMLKTLYPKLRIEAQKKAEEAFTQVIAGTTTADAPAVTGGWRDLGLVIWGETRELKEGIWSGPIELVGRFVLLRRDLSIPGLVPAADKFTVSILEFPYTPPDFTREKLATAQQKVQLSILDRDWENLVPSAWGKSLPTRWYEGPKN